MSSSLVHGIGNGLARFPGEVAKLEELGLENLAAIKSSVEAAGIECDLTSPGAVETAMTGHQFEELGEAVGELEQYGHEAELLDEEAMRSQLDSPLFTGGLWQKSGECLIDPVKLCDGLARLAEDLGVRIHENTLMTGYEESDGGVVVATSDGRISASQVLLATAAFHSPVRAIRRRVVPVFDYVLMSEPLTPAQWESIGWDNRQGFSDSANQFHYYRPTADGRILWGGYDAVYNYGGRVEEGYYQRDESFAGLAQRFFTAFPQLAGLRFSHRWGGAVASVVRAKGAFVEGLLYELGNVDLRALDRFEGHPFAYERVIRWVRDESGRRRRVMTYLQPEDGFEAWTPPLGYFTVLWHAYSRLGFDVEPLPFMGLPDSRVQGNRIGHLGTEAHQIARQIGHKKPPCRLDRHVHSIGSQAMRQLHQIFSGREIRPDHRLASGDHNVTAGMPSDRLNQVCQIILPACRNIPRVLRIAPATSTRSASGFAPRVCACSTTSLVAARPIHGSTSSIPRTPSGS